MSHYAKRPLKSLTLLLSGLLFSLSAMADSSQITEEDTLQQKDPKQCLTELQTDKKQNELTEEEKLEEQKKKELSWFDKLVKHHKLGSLHFQDIIELFH